MVVIDYRGAKRKIENLKNNYPYLSMNYNAI